MAKINDINPVLMIENNVMLLKDGSIALAYEMETPEIFTLGLNDYEEIITLLPKLFYSFLPENTVIQFQWYYKKKKFDSNVLPEKSFLQKSTKQHFNNRFYLEQKLYVFFILPKIFSYKKDYSSFKIIRKKGKEIKLNLEKVEKFKSLIEKLEASLNSTDFFKLYPLSEQNLSILLKNYFSFGNEYKTDLIKEKTGYRYGDKKIKIFSISDLESLPDQDIPVANIINERSTDLTKFYRPFIYQFGLEFFENHITTLIVYLDSNKYWVDKLLDENKKLNSSSLMGRENILNKMYNEEFLDALEQESRKILRFHYSVLIAEEDKEVLKKSQNYILSSFAKLGIKPYSPEKDQIYYLLGLFPGNGHELPKDETVLTYDEFPFLFFYPESNYKSDKNGFLFNDRLSQIPIFQDTFDKPYKTKLTDNRNFLVIAPSGGGKSFLIKSKLRQFIELKDSQTVVINIGGDDKIARLYKEESLYLKYEPGKSLNVNPFYLRENILSEDKKNFLIDFINILWKNGESLTNDELSSLENLIIKYYKGEKQPDDSFKVSLTKDKMNIKGFYEYLETNLENLKKENSLISYDSLKLNLKKFANGSYSTLFVKGEPEDLSKKKYVEFELDNIKDNKILFPIFSMLIADLTFNTMWKGKGPKLFFIDEAWKILENPGMSSMVKYTYKTIRKFNGSVGIAVQQINDIKDDEVGAAIIGNAGIKYLLNHSSVLNTIPILKERLGLSEKQISLLLSLRNDLSSKFPHSEFLLIMGVSSKVLRLETSKEAYVIYESDKDKLKLLDEIYYNEASENMETAVKIYIKKYLK